MLIKLPGEAKVYLNIDKAVCDNDEEGANYLIEFFNKITPSGMPSHENLGAIIML